MPTIQSRSYDWADTDPIPSNVLKYFMKRWKSDQEDLIDKLDAFLEMRLEEEFTELRDEIAKAKELIAVNDVLMQENMRFRDEITHLSIENLRLSVEAARE